MDWGRYFRDLLTLVKFHPYFRRVITFGGRNYFPDLTVSALKKLGDATLRSAHVSKLLILTHVIRPSNGCAQYVSKVFII